MSPIPSNSNTFTTTTATTAANTMLGIVYNYGNPKMVTIPIPTVTKTKVLVKIHAAGVNPVDAKNVFGDKLPDWVLCHKFSSWWTHNCIPGFDFSGTIQEIHPQSIATGMEVGDRVYGTVPPFTGTFCEYQVVPIDQIGRMPTSLSFVSAAAMPLTGLTCLQSLEEEFHVQSNSRLLIIGASGGTGHFAVQYAKHALRASRVVGVCSAANANWVTNLGADHVIDYHDTNAWKGEIRDQVRQYGSFTHVLDTVTSAAGDDQIMSYESFFRKSKLLQDGQYIRLGGPTSSWIAAAMKRVMGLNFWSHTDNQLFWVKFPQSDETLHRLQQVIDHSSDYSGSSNKNNGTRHHIQPHVSHEYEFSEQGVREAFAQLKSRRTRGKVVLKMIVDN